MGRLVTPGDVFFSGRLTTKLEELRGGVQHKDAMLHLDGVWTEPADTKCPHLHADADVFHKLELAAPAHPYHCGAMSFDVKPHPWHETNQEFHSTHHLFQSHILRRPRVHDADA